MRSFALLSLLLLTSCTPATTKAVTKGEEDTKKEDFLDNPVDVKRNKTRRAKAEDGFVLPEAPKKPSMAIDGDPKGWTARSRSFKSKDLVELGKGFWSGPRDASMQISLDTDDGYVYLLVDVQDDRVIDTDDDNGDPVDAVVVWLRDPKLHNFKASLPAETQFEDKLFTDVAIAISPDGRVRRYDERGEDFQDDAVQTAGVKTKRGYRVEVALKLELLPFVSSLPLGDIAFRVELLDGDDPKRAGVQTRMSMMPRSKGGAARFARKSLGGLLPHKPARGMTARADGIGYWKRSEKGWGYKSLEALSRVWFSMSDTEDFEAALRKEFAKKCPKARFDTALLEGYHSRSKKHRVGLYMCSTRTVRDTCNKGAQTRLFWVHMVPDADSWSIKRSSEIFDKPLKQCIGQAPQGAPLYQSFSMIPLDFLSSNLWALGWDRSHEDEGEIESVKGVTIINGKRSKPIVADLHTRKTRAREDSRTRSSSRIYFTDVDDEDGFDICEIERIEEQPCSGVNRGCRKGGTHSTSLHTHIKMWVPDDEDFKAYVLSKHRGCNGSFSFQKNEGFMLVHVGERLGLLASEANE